MNADPLAQPREDFAEILERICVPDSPVGIDAQLTHAIIIDYLRQISDRLERLEKQYARIA